jgi:lipoprotein-anchoring transpeptidase ErfK/SrfK
MEKAGASAGYKGSSPYAFYDSIENVKLMEQASFVEVQYGTDPDFLNAYTYDAGTHLYSRATGGTPTVEKETGEAIELANLLVFEAEHKTIDAKGRQAIGIGSGGKALLFQGGGVQEIEWSSEDGMLVPTVDGETVQLAPGKSWIHIVPADPGMGSSVRYTP